MGVARDAQKLGKDDPRRIAHSFKVGLAIAVVSLFYYFDFLYENGYGVSAMWVVMTVVVVFEFSMGMLCFFQFSCCPFWLFGIRFFVAV